MNDQLFCAAMLAGAGIAALAAGTPWLAVAALAGAIPFLAVGTARAAGGGRARRRQAAGSQAVS